MGFQKEMIQKAAIDYAREHNNREIVNLISKALDYKKMLAAVKEEHNKQIEEKDKEIQRLMDMIKKLQNQS